MPLIMRRSLKFLLVVFCLVASTGAFAGGGCVGPFKGKKLSKPQLAIILEYHQAWLDGGSPNDDERRAR